MMVTILDKNPPSVKEMWVQSMGEEDPLEKKWQPTPVFLPGKFHGGAAWGCSVYGIA